VAAVEVGGALLLGNDAELGHAMFQSLDSSAISSVATQGLKLAFGRARPSQGNDPDWWSQGGCCNSFQSGEVTLQSSFVTPIIVHYRAEQPWVWALEVLPLSPAMYWRDIINRRRGRLGRPLPRRRRLCRRFGNERRV
jgi:hypothetical protein